MHTEKRSFRTKMTQIQDNSASSPSYRLATRRLKGKKAKFATLKKQVIETGLCTTCGACIASCEEHALSMVNDRPRLTGKCTVCGVCFHQCPKTVTTTPQLIGNFIDAFKARSLLPEAKQKGQDGGVVTSLLLYLIRENMIDGAVTTIKDPAVPWKPKPIIAQNEEDVLSSAGSIYSQSQAVGKLLDAIRSGMHSVAFVGCPCNIDAVTKMQDSPYGLVRLFMRSSVLKIGLFCMDAFSYDRLKHFLEVENKMPMEDIRKMTISKGKFHFIPKEGAGDVISYSVHELDRLRSSSCWYCVDLSAENADIAVGSVGAPDGSNAVIVRTGLGMEILQDAAALGYIELEPLKNFNPILNLANKKKIQLYNATRRRSYAFDTPVTIPRKPTEVQAAALLSDKERKLRRRIVRVTKVALSENKRNLRVSLENRGGKVLEHVQVKINLLAGGLFEPHSWEREVREWFPAEALDFEVPRLGEESTYSISIFDGLGEMVTKEVSIADLLAERG